MSSRDASAGAPARPPRVRCLYEPQPHSRLLSLPGEIRLNIWKYMRLSPIFEESVHCTGAYFTCRQMQLELKEELNPEHATDTIISGKAVNADNPQILQIDHDLFKIHVTPSSFGLIRHVTLDVRVGGRIRIPSFAQSFHETLLYLYKLFIESLTVVFVGESNAFSDHYLPYGDMKSFRDSLFYDYVTRSQINCKLVTFTLDRLANVEGGRAKTQPLVCEHKTQNISWTLTIVQDEEDNQSERRFGSPTRFRRYELPLDPETERITMERARLPSPFNDAASERSAYSA